MNEPEYENGEIFFEEDDTLGNIKKNNSNNVVITNHKKKNYYILNKTNVEDSKLSLKAKGLFTYIISRPPNWKTNTTNLYKFSTDGRDAVQSALKELEKAGYLYRIKSQSQDGTITWIYLTFEEPVSLEQAKEEFKKERINYNLTKNTKDIFLTRNIRVPTTNGKPVCGKPVSILSNKVIGTKKSSRTLLLSPPSSLRSDSGDNYTFGDESFNNKLTNNNISTNISSPNLKEGKPPLGLEKNKIGFITNNTFVIKGKKVTTTSLQNKSTPALDVITKKITFTNNQKEVINYWNNKECLPKLRVPEITHDGYFIKPTKKFLNTLEFITKAMNGTLFKSLPGYTNISNSYSLEQIKKSIDNFTLTKSDLRIGSPNKRFLDKIYLDKFFYNPFSEFHSCPFLEYLKGVPKNITETTKIAKDKNPEMTKLIKEAYIDICVRTSQDTSSYETFEFTKMEENYLIKAGDLLTRYLNVADEKGILVWKGEEYFAKALIKAVKEKYTVDFKLSLLGQKFVYAGILYDFLNKKGLTR